MKKAVLILILVLVLSAVLGALVHWAVGVVVLLVLSNTLRLLLIKRLERIRDDINFTTFEGKVKIKRINESLNLLRLWKLKKKI